MWMFFTRAPRADVPYWPGRRALACADAVLWPAALAAGAMQLPIQTNLFGQVVVATCALAGIRRVWRASLLNHRYRFTVASVVGPLVVLLAVGAALMLGQ